MRTVYIVAAVPIVAVTFLSIAAGYLLGDLQLIPMQWNSRGSPTWYAPKWIGLSLIPAIGSITTINVVISILDKPRKKQIQDLAITGAFLVAGQAIYLFLLMRHVS